MFHDISSDSVVIRVRKEIYLQAHKGNFISNSETYLEPSHIELTTYASVNYAKSLNF